ncbi:MAG: SpoIVB peptidase [Acetatifactor sp.]|nr:SpoIVB peptidase [Acetatifactor sp.]
MFGKGNVKHVKTKKTKKWRMTFRGILTFAGLAFACIMFWNVTARIPSTLYFRADQIQRIDLGVPATGEVRAAFFGWNESEDSEDIVALDLSRPVTMRPAGQDRYDMEVRLFGFIPLKKVDLRVIGDEEVIPMGIPIGVYLQGKGVLVVGTAEFITENDEKAEPAKDLVKAGDYLMAIDGVALKGKDDLIKRIEESNGKTLTVTVEREGNKREVEITPVRNQGHKYKAGIWVRDNLQGVGTLTYVDADGKFGALGHGIADVDTGTVMQVKGGTLYQTKIVKLRRGKHGDPGEITGRIIYDEGFALGEISENSDLGVYGVCNDAGKSLATADAVPIGLKQEIELGPAQVLCTLEDHVETFEIEITKVRLKQDGKGRGIELRVTDTELLRRTGGIIQGMSGSPILQNGKIIGAVTHVLVSSPEKGYGIFIKSMLEEGSS